MSSRFVSAGGAEIKAPEGLSETSDQAWQQARRQVEEARKPHSSAAPAPGTQEGGVSLYEHLQAQKLAKQEAFEEASKLRNQFRPLDEAEVAFLESLKSKERTAAADVRKQTSAQLQAFKRQQAEAERLAAGDTDDPIDMTDAVKTTGSVSEWATGKKRRRIPDNAESERMKNVKSAHTSGGNEQSAQRESDETLSKSGSQPAKAAADMKAEKATSAASLIAYSSDSDD